MRDLPKQTGRRQHEFDLVAQTPNGKRIVDGISEVAFCAYCGKYQLHLTKKPWVQITKKRPELPEEYWL